MDQQTKVVVTDARVLVVGHSESKAACIAVTTAVQTFGRILAVQGLLERRIQCNPEIPGYEISYKDSDLARQAVAGLLDAFSEIAKACPGSMVVSDSRTVDFELPAPPPDDEIADESGSFCESLAAPALLVDGAGHPLRA